MNGIEFIRQQKSVFLCIIMCFCNWRKRRSIGKEKARVKEMEVKEISSAFCWFYDGQPVIVFILTLICFKQISSSSYGSLFSISFFRFGVGWEIHCVSVCALFCFVFSLGPGDYMACVMTLLCSFNLLLCNFSTLSDFSLIFLLLFFMTFNFSIFTVDCRF